MLITRQTIATVRKMTRQDLPQTEGGTEYTDVTAWPVHLDLPFRARRVDEIRSEITVHITSIKGGFGLSARQVDRWEALLETSEARKMALLERYAGCAYHWIISRELGIIRNHDPLLRTSHGNRGNRGIGFALDVGIGEDLSAEFANQARRGLILAVDDLRTRTGEAVNLTAHRCFSSKRRADPGEIVWSQVVRPVANALRDATRIDYTLAEDSGRPIPRSWDPSALFDDRGRRL